MAPFRDSLKTENYNLYEDVFFQLIQQVRSGHIRSHIGVGAQIYFSPRLSTTYPLRSSRRLQLALLPTPLHPRPSSSMVLLDPAFLPPLLDYLDAPEARLYLPFKIIHLAYR